MRRTDGVRECALPVLPSWCACAVSTCRVRCPPPRVVRSAEAGCAGDSLSRPMARHSWVRRLGGKRPLRRGVPGRGSAVRRPQLRAGAGQLVLWGSVSELAATGRNVHVRPQRDRERTSGQLRHDDSLATAARLRRHRDCRCSSPPTHEPLVETIRVGRCVTRTFLVDPTRRTNLRDQSESISPAGE